MSKISNCQVCSVSFPVGPGCRGIYCSPECSAIGIKNRYQEIAKQQKIEKEKVYLQSPDYLKNVTGAFSQEGFLEYLVLYSKQGKIGTFGFKA